LGTDQTCWGGGGTRQSGLTDERRRGIPKKHIERPGVAGKKHRKNRGKCSEFTASRESEVKKYTEPPATPCREGVKIDTYLYWKNRNNDHHNICEMGTSAVPKPEIGQPEAHSCLHRGGVRVPVSSREPLRPGTTGKPSDCSTSDKCGIGRLIPQRKVEMLPPPLRRKRKGKAP